MTEADVRRLGEALVAMAEQANAAKAIEGTCLHERKLRHEIQDKYREERFEREKYQHLYEGLLARLTQIRMIVDQATKDFATRVALGERVIGELSKWLDSNGGVS